MVISSIIGNSLFTRKNCTVLLPYWTWFNIREVVGSSPSAPILYLICKQKEVTSVSPEGENQVVGSSASQSAPTF